MSKETRLDYLNKRSIDLDMEIQRITVKLAELADAAAQSAALNDHLDELQRDKTRVQNRIDALSVLPP